jgi:hypothetical protein
MAKSESNDASGAAQDRLDNVERYVNAAVGPRLPDGSDPVEAAIRDQHRSVERKYSIAMHEAVCWSLENAPRLEAARKLSQLKLLGIADDDPRCQMKRLRADGYPESDPRVQLARLRAEGVSEDHPLVKQLNEEAKQSPPIDRKEFHIWWKTALKRAHLQWDVITGSQGANRRWFTGRGQDDGKVGSRIVRKAREISRSEGLPLPSSVELFIVHNRLFDARPPRHQISQKARHPPRLGADS